MRKPGAILLIALLLLTAPVFADGGALEIISGQYFFLFPATIIIVIIMLSMTRVFSGALNMPQLDAWIKTELREIVAAVLLFVIVLAVVEGANKLTEALSLMIPGATYQTDYVTQAQTISTDLATNAVNAYEGVIKAVGRLRSTASYSVYTTFGGFILYAGGGSTRFGGLYPLISAMQMSTNGLTNSILLYQSINVLIGFFQYIAPAIIFPLAFSLRAIPFTRQLGNTLIAVALALYLFFPLSVIFVDGFHNLMGGVPNPASYLTTAKLEKLSSQTNMADIGSLLTDQICSSFMLRSFLELTELGYAFLSCLPLIEFGPFFELCFEIEANLVYPIIYFFASNALGILLTTSNEAMRSIELQAVYNIVYDYLVLVNNLVVTAYVDVLVIGLITIGGARSVSQALGGEAYMAGIERLI